MDENKKDDKEPKIIIKNTTDLQRLKLSKLMKNPDKPIIIPERPKDKGVPVVPDFVRNVMGSSAGAGSGEFHVYRHLRRKEYARQKFMQEKASRDKLDEDYRKKLEENKKLAVERTEKKRLKRLKKKKNRKKPGKPLNKQTSTEESESSQEDEEDEKPTPMETEEIKQSTESSEVLEAKEEIKQSMESSEVLEATEGIKREIKQSTDSSEVLEATENAKQTADSSEVLTQSISNTKQSIKKLEED